MSTATRKPFHELKVVALVGPTAVGKTEIAERVALSVGGEIISADSMQVYRSMDIGTAKPPCEKRTVPYHCIDLVDPGEDFSAALFQKYARLAIADITRRGRIPILVGGTGLYVSAALDNLRFPPGEVTSDLRNTLETQAALLGPKGLHARLAEIDPASAAMIHPNNVRRTIRALEMAASGISYAQQAIGLSCPQDIYDTVRFGLTMNRTLLYSRINERVEAMLANGLLEEVGELINAGLRNAVTASQAIGYKEFVGVLENRVRLSDAIAATQQATRRYAKRQLTWFRRDKRIRWIDVTERSPAEAADRILKLIESGDPSPYPQDIDGCL